MIKGIEEVQHRLGKWQHFQLTKNISRIRHLTTWIDKLVDASILDYNTKRLREVLDRLYEEEECYWVQRSKVTCLRRGIKIPDSFMFVLPIITKRIGLRVSIMLRVLGWRALRRFVMLLKIISIPYSILRLVVIWKAFYEMS